MDGTRLANIVVKMMRGWLVFTGGGRPDFWSPRVDAIIVGERVNAFKKLIFGGENTLSDSEVFQCGASVFHSVFGGGDERSFSKGYFLEVSGMCLTPSETLELVRAVWPDVFVDNRSSPAPIQSRFAYPHCMED